MARAGRLRPTVGIDPLYDQLAPLLDEERLPSLLFVGPRGAGKTALVRRLARGLLDRSRGEGARRRCLRATSADRIIAGMIYPGMWQRCRIDMVGELADTSDVLFVDRIADARARERRRHDRRAYRARCDRSTGSSLVAECDEGSCARASGSPRSSTRCGSCACPEATPAQAIPLLEPYGQRQAPPSRSATTARRLVELLAAFRRDTALPGKASRAVDYLALRAAARSGAAPAAPRPLRPPTTPRLRAPHPRPAPRPPLRRRPRADRPGHHAGVRCVVQACLSSCSPPSRRSTPPRSPPPRRGVVGQDPRVRRLRAA